MPAHRAPAPQSLGDALSRIDARTRQATEGLERVRAFAAALERVRGRGRSAGVEVVVNHVGLMVQVTYPDPVGATAPGDLSVATMTALRAALGDALGQVADRARATWGDDPLAGQVVAELRARFAEVGR